MVGGVCVVGTGEAGTSFGFGNIKVYTLYTHRCIGTHILSGFGIRIVVLKDGNQCIIIPLLWLHIIIICIYTSTKRHKTTALTHETKYTTPAGSITVLQC